MNVSLVIISLVVCSIVLHSFGSIGIGTLISAILTGAFMKLIKVVSERIDIKFKGENLNDTNRSRL